MSSETPFTATHEEPESVYHTKCSSEKKKPPVARWRTLFHRLLHRQAPSQLTGALSSRRGAGEEVISQWASGTITLMESCIRSGEALKSLSVKFHNYSSHSSTSTMISRADATDSPCSCCAFLARALCISHTSLTRIGCFLLSIPPSQTRLGRGAPPALSLLC